MQTFNNRQIGFTLLELMIVVAIIGIISAIAYPSYTEQVRKTKRADLTGDLLECSGILERRFTVNRTYGPTAANVFCDSIDNNDYAITVVGTEETNSRTNGFLITAAPSVDGGMTSDTKCTSFTLDHLGIKGASGDDTDACWRS
jgi:type IV pilus assembly protein PilE